MSVVNALSDFQQRPHDPAVWEELAVAYNYSVVGLIDDLAAANVWPVDAVTGQLAGYKRVYTAERYHNLRGVGHFVNTASNRFSDFKP